MLYLLIYGQPNTSPATPTVLPSIHANRTPALAIVKASCKKTYQRAIHRQARLIGTPHPTASLQALPIDAAEGVQVAMGASRRGEGIHGGAAGGEGLRQLGQGGLPVVPQVGEGAA